MDSRFSNSQDSAALHLHNVHPHFSNAIRRSFMSLTPSMRFDHAYIKCIDSLMKDEDLVHRLGLIPLYINPNVFQFEIESDAGFEFESDGEISARIGYGSGHRPGYPNAGKLMHQNKE